MGARGAGGRIKVLMDGGGGNDNRGMSLMKLKMRGNEVIKIWTKWVRVGERQLGLRER